MEIRASLGGGVFWLEAASIYVGSTLADQTNVLPDGIVPAFSDQKDTNGQ
jgi:hypothetical protein